jgi:beta-galactosidase
MPRFPLLRCALLWTALLISVSTVLRAQPIEIYGPTASTPSVSLNGSWQFRYYEGTTVSGDDAKFYQPGAFDASNWKSITVPGHWELQGFAEPKYGKELVNGTGLYRHVFRVPAEWKDQRVMLRFEGVLYGFEVWLNGTSLGTWSSGYNPATFDLTDHLLPNRENLLAVRVTTHPKGWEFDTNDCWSLSGIYRDVTLFAVPPTHLQRYTARTTLGESGNAWLEIKAEATASATLAGRLLTPNGTVVRTFALPLEPSGETSVEIDQAQLWTAETPHLYTLELTLTAPNQTPQIITEKIGLREVSIVDGTLRLNGTPIKLRGVNHHDLWPETGRTASLEQLRRDLELIRDANINFVRTAHYPPDKRLLALCDELGLYVMCEIPFGYGDEHLTKPDYQDILLTRARATVLRDENHPSVIIWSIGNENPNTPLTFRTGEFVKQLDPSRPICFPQVGSYFGRTYQEIPEWVDIYAPHYPVNATVERYPTQLDRPIIHTEYAHALGLATDRVQDQWSIIQDSPRYAGAAIWMFQDQGILRTAAQPVARNQATQSAWVDSTRYYDTHGLDGMDGLVYADRTPSVDYWQVRAVYTPVQIVEETLPLHAGRNELTLHLRNRYNFRSLDGYSLEWIARENGHVIATGRAPLTTPANETTPITLAVDWPKKYAPGFAWLEVIIRDQHNRPIAERSLRFTPMQAPAVAPRTALSAELRAGRLRVTESADAVSVQHPRFTVRTNLHTGETSIVDATGGQLATGFLPHSGRRLTEAEKLRGEKEVIWQPGALSAISPPTITTKETRGRVTITIVGRYTHMNQPEQVIEGTHTIQVNRDGTIDLDYEFKPAAGFAGQLTSAGLVVNLPPDATEFRWLGRGPYASSPGKDALSRFGRHHLTRDDLHFQGNRSDVEFASVTSAVGHGLFVLPIVGQDLSVERSVAGIQLAHNALLSGLGNKGVRPETFIEATSATVIRGSFTLLALDATWPKTVRAWLGEPSAQVEAFAPFFHSYDQ